MASSCLDEIAAPQPETGSELTTLVPRVKSFTNQYVTKATDPYTENEKKIEKLTVLIFSGIADEQENHRLIYTHQTNGSSLMLNKSELNTIASSSELTSATVVMFANVNLADIMKENSDGSYTTIGNSLTLEELNDCSIHMGDSPVVLGSELETFSGFPMKGVATANLTTGSSTSIVVNLQILYAKVNFEIGVDTGTENQNYEGVTPSFTLHKYFVHNVAKRTAVELADGAATASTDHVTAGREVTGSNNTFTFYIPESRYNPKSTENGKIDLTGIYPTGWTTSIATEDVKGYTDAMTDQLNGVKYFYDDLVQQYKPKLAEGTAGTPSNTAEGLATYVIVQGSYVDYRNTTWDVNYKIYLGKDNAQNFHVDRNSEYKNYLTIKGIRNNDSYTDAGSVWIDHRVDVELGNNQGADDCVTITRETLIDAHIEVRPLRVKLAGTKYTEAAIYLPKYPKTGTSDWVQIDEIMGGDNENWIAIENNNGLQNKGIQYSSNGKRKYFTTSLIEELHAESSEIKIDSDANRYIPLRDGDCAWIYFDENGTSNARRARIDVVFYYYSGEKKNSVTESYYVYQSGYTSVGDLKIENYEEYLHSYDSADKYGLNTSPADYTQQGLEWGHKGKVFSQNNIVSQIDIGSLLTNTTANMSLIKDVRYDYFHSSDVSATQIPYLYSANYNWSALTSEQLNKETGLFFTERATAVEPDPITIIDMSTLPSSAYQYCLSKNKFREDADGNHTLDIHWYLPDVNELKTVLGVNNLGADLSTDSYYWSSQPAYTDRLDGDIIKAIESVFGNGVILDENPDQARAVSISVIEDKDRNTQNRIRCFYSATSLTANMSDRVPSGLGDLIKIPLKAYESYTTSTLNKPAYFYDWLSDLDDTHKKYVTPTEPSYAYPKGEDAYTFDEFVFNNVRYYTKNPALKASWSTDVVSQTLYYYPGLSAFNVEVQDAVYRESDQLKTYSRTETVYEGEYINALPSNDQLAAKTNTYTDISDYVVLSFSAGTNESNSPTYAYRREDRATKYTYTKNWVVPEYEEKNINEPSGSDLGKIQLKDVLASAQYVWYNEGSDYTYNNQTYKVKSKRSSGGKYYLTLQNETETFEIQLETKSAAWTYANHNVGDNYIHEGIWYKITKKEDQWYLNRYYFTLGPTTVKKTGYLYKAGTGHWGTESGPDGGSSAATAQVVDKLEFFGGNSFTITAKSGYRIKSIKVNFSDDNGVKNMIGGDWSYRNLRLVLGNQTLPTTSTPTNMSYSGDGEFGWYQWTAPTVEDYATSVTLKLAAYTPTSASLRPTSYEYEAASQEDGYQSDFATSIVIDSFEIRVEKPTTSNDN